MQCGYTLLHTAQNLIQEYKTISAGPAPDVPKLVPAPRTLLDVEAELLEAMDCPAIRREAHAASIACWDSSKRSVCIAEAPCLPA